MSPGKKAEKAEAEAQAEVEPQAIAAAYNRIPPVLPWQVRLPDGSALTPSAPNTTITPTIVGRRVDCVFVNATGRSTQWSFGVNTTAGYQNSTNNTAGIDYPAAGTYTIVASDGQKTGTINVTVT